MVYLMRYLPIFLMLFVALVISPAISSERSFYKDMGQLTAYGEYCGYFKQAREIDKRLHSNEEFRRSKRRHDMSRADKVMNPHACAQIKKSLDKVIQMFEQIEEREKGSTRQQRKEEMTNCLVPGASATVLMSRTECVKLDGMPLVNPIPKK
jgi:hypothetical protein